MRGKGNGWLTAEYSMLPGSTPIRTMRETSAQKRSGRTIEISRLIGRALRSVTQLAGFGEHTIFIDCDVLQADGSTRTASVTAAYLALRAAEMRWLDSGFIRRPLLTEEVAAVSVGVTPESRVLLDIDYSEDSTIGADFNFVMTRSQKIIEMQGTAESLPLPLALHDELRAMALVGLDQLFKFYMMSDVTFWVVKHLRLFVLHLTPMKNSTLSFTQFLTHGKDHAALLEQRLVYAQVRDFSGLRFMIDLAPAGDSTKSACDL